MEALIVNLLSSALSGGEPSVRGVEDRAPSHTPHLRFGSREPPREMGTFAVPKHVPLGLLRKAEGR